MASVVTEQNVSSLHAKFLAPPSGAKVDVWNPLTAEVSNPASATAEVCVEDIVWSADDVSVQIDVDHLHRGVKIRPGETYRVVLPILFNEPGQIELNRFKVCLKNQSADVAFQSAVLTVEPALRKEIQMEVDAICAYGDGVKAAISFIHQGVNQFEKLEIKLGPSESLKGGKIAVRRSPFERGDEERVELIAASKEITVHLHALLDNNLISDEIQLAIPEVVKPKRDHFRFLNPRRLSTDQVNVYRLDDRHDPLKTKDGVYPMVAGQKYEVVITPHADDATSVELRDIPNVLHVLRRDRSEDGRRWIFVVDAASTGELFSRPECLYYDVKTQSDPTTGEVHLRLRPRPWRHLKFALALGIALTLQGAVAAGRIVQRVVESADYTLADAFGEASIGQNYRLLFLSAVPIVWMFLGAVDWVQYRWKQ